MFEALFNVGLSRREEGIAALAYIFKIAPEASTLDEAGLDRVQRVLKELDNLPAEWARAMCLQIRKSRFISAPARANLVLNVRGEFGSLLQYENLQLVVESLARPGMRFLAQFLKAAPFTRIKIMEPYMKADDAALPHTALEICLGQIELPLLEALALEPGSKIEFELPEVFQGTVRLAGALFATAEIRLRPDRVEVLVQRSLYPETFNPKFPNTPCSETKTEERR